jgi:hypothetical protein
MCLFELESRERKGETAPEAHCAPIRRKRSGIERARLHDAIMLDGQSISIMAPVRYSRSYKFSGRRA